jgi:RNA ligase (TIGR02306 family)
MERKLVTIRTVSEVNPIEGADSIECLTVEGWKVVSQKGNFQPGDLAVYFEIDSFLPDGNELWQDLVDKSSREYEGRKGHVLRTIKLRGQVSQGFCIPLKKVKEGVPAFAKAITDVADSTPIDYPPSAVYQTIRNVDFAESLGVVKYEPAIPAELAGQVKGPFPSFIKKTDQERCQNLAAEIFADLDAKYEVTIKLDGSSMTVFHDPEGTGGVCSRNFELNTVAIENEGNTLVKLAKESGLLERMKQYPTYAVQGELMGPGIQGNREQLIKPALYIYDVWNTLRGGYLTPTERSQFLVETSDVGVHHVPVLHEDVSLRELGITNTEQLLAFAEGKSLRHDVREGLVFKRMDGKFSFKAISNKFLLKQKE